MAIKLSTRDENHESVSLIHENSHSGFWNSKPGKITAIALLLIASIPVVTAPVTLYFAYQIWTDLHKDEGLPAPFTASSGEIHPTHHDSISTPRIRELSKLHIEVNALRQEILELDNPREREIPAMTDGMDIEGLDNLRSGLTGLKNLLLRDQARQKLFIEVNELRQGILELDNPENRPIPVMTDSMSTRHLGNLQHELTELRLLIIQDRDSLVDEVQGLRGNIVSMISRLGNPNDRPIPLVTDSMSADELVALRGELPRLRELIIQDQGIEQLKGMLGQSRGDLEKGKLNFIQMSKAALKEFAEKAAERRLELSTPIEELTREWHKLSEEEKRLEALQSDAPDVLEAMREKVKSLEKQKKALTQQYEEISEADDLREIAAKMLGLRKKTSKETLKEKRETVEQHQSALRDQIESHWKYMHSIPEQIREVQRARSRINHQLDPLRAELSQIDDQRYKQLSSNRANLKKFDAFIARIDELEQEVLRVEKLSLDERSNEFSGTQGIDHTVRGLLNVDVRDFVRDLKWLAMEHIRLF